LIIKKEETGMKLGKFFIFFIIFFLAFTHSFKVIKITVEKPVSLLSAKTGEQVVTEKKTFKENLYLIKGMGYLDANSVRNIYGMDVKFIGKDKKILIGDKIVLKSNSMLLYINGIKRSLRKAPIILKSKLYIPLELFLTKAFSGVSGLRSLWDFSKKTLRVFKSDKYDFVKFYSFPDFDRLYFEIKGNKKIEVERDKKRKILKVKIENPIFFEKLNIESDLIKKVVFRGNILIVYLTDKVEDYSFKKLNSDWILDIKKKKEKIHPVTVPKFKNDKKKIKTIIIDPGHGGKDPGAIGRRGLKEKNVVLDIARRVAKKLHKKGFHVILTRNYDVYLPLSQRTMIANRRNGDIFISIHCNASYKKKSRGIEVYFLSDRASDEESKRVAEFENAVLDMEQDDMELAKVNQILWSLAMNKYMNESSLLGRTVLDELKKYFPSPPRGVKQAGFYVLKGAQMPSILIEVGFITNKKEEKLLSKRKYREKIAEAIAKGLMDYIDLKREKK